MASNVTTLHGILAQFKSHFGPFLPLAALGRYISVRLVLLLGPLFQDGKPMKQKPRLGFAPVLWTDAAERFSIGSSGTDLHRTDSRLSENWLWKLVTERNEAELLKKDLLMINYNF